MADWPSIGYDSTSNIELDREYVTSAVGPKGAETVTWSLSTRISNGLSPGMFYCDARNVWVSFVMQAITSKRVPLTKDKG